MRSVFVLNGIIDFMCTVIKDVLIYCFSIIETKRKRSIGDPESRTSVSQPPCFRVNISIWTSGSAPLLQVFIFDDVTRQ